MKRNDVSLRLLLLSLLVRAAGHAQQAAQQPALPTPAQVHDQRQPPGFDVGHPGRTPGEKVAPGMQGEAPLDTPAAPALPDASTQSSPVMPHAPATAHTGGLRLGTEIRMHFAQDVSSGEQRNGDLVEGTLAAAVSLANGRTLPQGARVTATVVSSARAGTIQSGGVLSLELVRVDGIPVVTDIQAFDGTEGHKDVADSLPEKGTEATVRAGTVLPFHVTS